MVKKNNYLEAFLTGLAPDPLIDIDDWSDRYRILSSAASAEPGPWRTSRVPYMREVFKCLSPSSPVEEVVVMKGAQLGFTEAATNWIGYIIDVTSGPVLAVQPTVDMAKRYSRQRVEQLIETSSRIRDKIKEARSRDSGNTILSKEFPGGILVLTGANSATGLRSLSARFLLLDEIDAYPNDLDGEGDPLLLAKARTRTFSRRKMFLISTPTMQNRSKIEKEFMQGDQRSYFVPCPFCKALQTIEWKKIHYKKDPLRPTLECIECGKHIKEHHKTWMLAEENGAKWIPKNPGANNGKTASFHLNSLYSPVGWFSWADAVKIWVDSNKIQERLRGFVNTVLGETWKDKGDAPDWERLYERREPYLIGKIPLKGVVLVAGADVQKDRIEVEIKAYGVGKESWSIDYRVFIGDTSNSESSAWSKLDELLNEFFPHECGAQVPIMKLAVDSGFNTQAVYNWCRKHSMAKVMATKGVDSSPVMIGQPSAVDVSVKGKRIARGFKIWPIGVGLVKSELYGWLKLPRPLDGEDYPPGYCHFPEYGDEYFKQLTAEQLSIRSKNGFSKYYWEKVRERNEVLDCNILCRVAAASVGLDRLKPENWDAIQTQLGVVTRAVEEKNPEDKKKGPFVPGVIQKRKSEYW